jgi:putative mRNA 3-end processing factor
MKWDISSLERKANITSSGAILLGNYVVCDGFEWGREVAIVTHIHADHITYFERCLGSYEFIFCSSETKELLITLKGEWLGLRRNLIALPYKKPYLYKEERITLYPAKHILGSAQVLVEDKDGVRIAYTGDFNFPNTKPIRTDILVLDATFGDPAQIAKFNRDEIIDRLSCLVKKELQTSSVCILAHRGKLQEVMGILRETGLSVSFLCAPDIFRMSMVYQKYGASMGNMISLEDNAAQDIIQKGERHIIFHLLGRRLQLLPKGIHYTKIKVSRWGTKEPYYTISDDYYVVALSDHADFNGTLEYVQECKPKLVITDNYRAGSADYLAHAIRNQLHIEAKPMPSSH